VHRSPEHDTALLLGESGHRKELVARAIHDASEPARQAVRRGRVLGLTESLFESELFGHERGASPVRTPQSPAW